MADPEFRRDLYRGTARDYDRFRVPYPQALIDDLAGRSGADGQGRLLDLACGTGQVTFALQPVSPPVSAPVRTRAADVARSPPSRRPAATNRTRGVRQPSAAALRRRRILPTFRDIHRQFRNFLLFLAMQHGFFHDLGTSPADAALPPPS
jgi:SAM-dependent methyltransferase